MRMAMEDCEEADDADRRRDRSLDAEGDHGAEHDHRQRNAQLDEGDGDPAHAEQAAHRHHADEGGRQRPSCAAAELKGEDADHDHCEDVVEAADRMHEAVQQPGGVTQPGMG